MILLTIFLCSGCAIIPREDDTVAPPLKEPPQVTYESKEIKKATIERKIQCSGHFISISQKDLSFKNQNGKLKSINVKYGDKVKKGQLIAELITDNILNSVQQQQVTLDKSVLSISNTRINNARQEETLKLEIKNLKKEYSNMKLLPDVYSSKELQDTLDKLNEKQASYNSTVLTNKNSLALAENDIKLNKLELEKLNQQLADSRIIAPIDGVVSYVNEIKVGDNVEAYKTLVSISDPNDLVLTYSDDQVSYFALGSKVNIKCSNKEFKGTVVQTPATMPKDADENIKNSVMIKADASLSEYKIGDIAEISLMLEKKEDTVVIPKSSLQTMGARKYVYVLENGIRSERDVETGTENQSEIEVIKGLSEGDKLIID
jgi:macrolide-specific efflux system membrane fusion protein